MVGRITDQTQLPGGARLLMKRARDAGGWFTWATGGGWYAAPRGGSKPRVLVKGRSDEGERFVVSYVDGKAHTAYILLYPYSDGHFAHATIAEVRAYIGGDGVPSKPETREG
jgi:hypothetical protein